MTIDPKWALFLSMFLAAMGFLVGAGSQFTDLGLSPVTVKAIIALFVLLLGLGNAINAVLVAFGMTSASRLAAVQQVPLPQKLDSLVKNNPEVQAVVTTTEIANATASDKVISNGH